MATPLRIPSNLAATVVRWTGDQGRAWLEALPATVAEVVAAWDLELDAPFEPGGNISWVAPVRRRHDDLDAVLKVQLPDPESEPEAAGLAAWQGDGIVRLYDHDVERRALLLERCRPGGSPDEDAGALGAVEARASIAHRLHRHAVPAGIPTLAAVLTPWSDTVEDRLERQSSLDRGLVEVVLATMREQPDRCTNPVLLHGDLNPTNVLAAEREPWLAIDPKPMVGDPAYDGPRLVLQPDPLRTADPAATLKDRLDVVAAVLEVDGDLLVRWCLVDAVQIGSFGREHDDLEMATWSSAQVDLLLAHL